MKEAVDCAAEGLAEGYQSDAAVGNGVVGGEGVVEGPALGGAGGTGKALFEAAQGMDRLLRVGGVDDSCPGAPCRAANAADKHLEENTIEVLRQVAPLLDDLAHGTPGAWCAGCRCPDCSDYHHGKRA